jgi:predicted N-formylglutamate amidohydrolase
MARSAAALTIHRRTALFPAAAQPSFQMSFTAAPRRSFTFTTAAPAPVRQMQAVTEAVEVIDQFPAIPSQLMLTCEHASVRLPEPWQWPDGDARLLGMHWSFDAGAEDFTRELSARLPSVAVLARFSRLLCDANRPLGAETMFRNVADGQPVLLNDSKSLTKG